jgi:hypothetical protein
VKHYIKEYLSFGIRESIEDTRELVGLWDEVEQEDFKTKLINSNKSLLQLDKEIQPMVSYVRLSEIQPFKEMPVENASEAYAINVSITYEEGNALDLTFLGLVVAKIDGEWKNVQSKFIKF